MPKRRKPCSAIQRCSPSENRRRRPFGRAQVRRFRPARANRYTTDTAGGTAPNWKVIASQVDPQMRTEVRYRPRMLTSLGDILETVGGGVNLIGRGFDSRHLHVAAARTGRCAIGSYQGTFDGVARRRLSRARRRAYDCGQGGGSPGWHSGGGQGGTFDVSAILVAVTFRPRKRSTFLPCGKTK